MRALFLLGVAVVCAGMVALAVELRGRDSYQVTFPDGSEDERLWACYTPDAGEMVCLEFRAFVQHLQSTLPTEM